MKTWGLYFAKYCHRALCTWCGNTNQKTWGLYFAKYCHRALCTWCGSTNQKTLVLALLLIIPPSNTRVEQLVQQLDSPKLAEREAAERSLIEAGPDVLDMLSNCETPLSAETERRIARIRGAIEEKIVQQWAKPTKITLDRSQMTLGELFQTVQQQTGNRVVVGQQAAQRPLDCEKIDKNKNTFWKFVESAATLSSLQIHPLANDRAIELAPSKPPTPPLCPAGPFLLSITPKDKTRLELTLFWEPRLEPIWLKLALKEPNGETAGTYELNPSSETISTQLTVPAPIKTSNQPITGTLTGVITAPDRTFRFPLAEAKNRQQQRFAQVALQLLSVRMEGSDLRLAARLRYTQAHGGFESYRGWFFKNNAYLVNHHEQSGQPPKRLSPVGMETDNRTANSIDLIYHFKLDGEMSDYNFVYTTPIALILVEYDFPELQKPSLSKRQTDSTVKLKTEN